MHELTGIDADIFLENLNRELTEDERREVREWALGDTSCDCKMCRRLWHEDQEG